MKKKSFTLIELLVTMAIIAILAGMIILALMSARDRARQTRVRGALYQYRSQLEASVAGQNYASIVGVDSPGVSADGSLATGNFDTLVHEMQTNGGGNFHQTLGNARYRILVQLGVGANYYCINSEGAITETSANPIVAHPDPAINCP